METHNLFGYTMREDVITCRCDTEIKVNDSVRYSNTKSDVYKVLEILEKRKHQGKGNENLVFYKLKVKV